MINDDLVSIITPAYNAEKYLSDTIESVLKQTYCNWEMLIIDDASTDSTKEIIKEYCNKDKRIKLLELDKNSGAAAAKNKGLENAKGRYIAFVDSDDLWKETKLQRQIAFMNERKTGFSFTAYEFFCDNSNVRKVISITKSVTYKRYLKNTIIGNSTVILDREIIGNFSIVEGYLEDVLTWMSLLKQGNMALGLNENLTSYRVYRESKSGKKLKNAKRYFKCLMDTQNLSFCYCVVCELFYIINAMKKRLFAKRYKVL